MKTNFEIINSKNNLHIKIHGVDLIPCDGYPPIPFARFLAYNFWRLLHETEIRNNHDFRCAHEIGSIGLGFKWPKIIFMRKNEFIDIDSDHGEFQIPIDEFQNEIMSFVASCSKHDKPLKCLWHIVLEDLNDNEQKNLRIHEAIRGLDPGSLEHS